jgi:hypothetical protein
MAHTPGPWKLWKCLDSEDERKELPYAIWMESETGTQKVAEFFMQDLPSMEDAQLMTASLELLEACKHSVAHHLTYEDESGVVKITLESYAMIVAAIRRAEPHG